MGYACDFKPDITPDETLQTIHEYEGLIINSKILVNQAFLDKALSLRFVGRLGSGMEIVDRQYAAQKGVAIISSPEGNRNAVAEQALGMLLALSNNLMVADQEVRAKIWEREKNRGWELMGKTIGIIGFGHTGKSFTRKLQGMDMQILIFDKYLPVGYTSDTPFAKETTLEDIQQQADIISLHLPLTQETKHLVDANFIGRCKSGFVLINTSRGACIKTKDVVEALESGKIGGACLDVFENEKPATFTPDENRMYEQLYAMKNVVVSPHIAGWTHDSKLRMAKVLLQKLNQISLT